MYRKINKWTICMIPQFTHFHFFLWSLAYVSTYIHYPCRFGISLIKLNPFLCSFCRAILLMLFEQTQTKCCLKLVIFNLTWLGQTVIIRILFNNFMCIAYFLRPFSTSIPLPRMNREFSVLKRHCCWLFVPITHNRFNSAFHPN